MARYRQKLIDGEYVLVPIDESAERREGLLFSSGAFEPFRSNVDGTLIRNGRELREHNRRNNVVLAEEFGTEFFEKKEKERRRIFAGERTREQTFRDRQAIYDTMIRMERQNG